MRALIRTTIVSATVAGALLAGAVPAHAVDVFVEVSPQTVQAGFSVAIRASCGDTVNSANVKSDAFGEVMVIPQNGFLIASVGVPPDKRAGNFVVRLTCPSGRTATTTLVVLAMNQPTRGPQTGGGALANGGGDSATRTLLIGGLGMVGIGSLLGAFALHRRRTANRA